MDRPAWSCSRYHRYHAWHFCAENWVTWRHVETRVARFCEQRDLKSRPPICLWSSPTEAEMPCCRRWWNIKYVLSGGAHNSGTQRQKHRGGSISGSNISTAIDSCSGDGSDRIPLTSSCPLHFLCVLLVSFLCACAFMCDSGWKSFQGELLKSSLACLTRADRDALTCSFFLPS